MFIHFPTTFKALALWQELIQRVIPFVIRRFLPDNTYEDWKA